MLFTTMAAEYLHFLCLKKVVQLNHGMILVTQLVTLCTQVKVLESSDKYKLYSELLPRLS